METLELNRNNMKFAYALPLIPFLLYAAFLSRFIWRTVMATKFIVLEYANTKIVTSCESEDEARGIATRLAEQTAGRTLTIAKVVATVESKANVSVHSH